MLSLSLMLALCGANPGSPAPASSGTATLDLYVFEDGAPVAGLPVEVGGERLGSTDDTGGLSATIPSGRQQLVVLRGGEKVVDLDLLTDVNEIVQIIAALRAGEEADLDIESSGTTAPLASAREGQEAAGAPEETQQPPGALVGSITSSEEDKPVANARVFFSGTTVEARTGEDGRYAVELRADSYSVSVVHPDYATQTLDDIRVIPGKEVTANIELTPAGVRLQDYVVTAPYVEGSIASTLEAQRETSSVLDVLGAEQMAATGDSNAAEALQRVSGLTIESGKFVLVRGQPNRFTLTLWNGSPLPSPEPLVRSIPLDLFPTGVLSGIDVQKSYTSDRLASFGSGLVDLRTRGIPDEGFVSTTVSGGYNSESTFQEGRTYRGGALDFLGFDDGTRALPEEVQTYLDAGNTQLPGSSSQRNEFGRTFSNNYLQLPQTMPPDFGVGLAAGDSVDIFGDGQLGAVTSLKWGTSWREQDRIQNDYVVRDGQTTLLEEQFENRTDFNSDIGGLLTVQAKWDNHELASNTFYAHQTQQRTELTTGNTRQSQAGDIRNFLLSWIERQLIAQQLTGSHELGFFELDYRGMYARADRYAPDRRTYDFIDDNRDGNFRVFDTGLSRQYDTVDDQVWSFGVDGLFHILDPAKSWLGIDGKVGTAGFFQDRTTLGRSYNWRVDDENGGDVSQNDPEILYDPLETGRTLSPFRDFSASRQDDSVGRLYTVGGYGLADLRFGDIFRLVGGLRYERTEEEVTTFFETPDEDRAVVGGFVQEGADGLFPSASGTWFIGDEMQVRAAYGRTTAYPNLNELSTAQFVDPDSGERFVGNPDLQPSIIDGADLRWEWYPSPTESLTLGVFWKDYKNPIERTFEPVAGSNPIATFQNAESARILGVEAGGRFEFGNFRDWWGGPGILDRLYFLGNFAIMNSQVQLSRQGIATNSERPLDGQAEYTINAQLGYSGEIHDVTVAFNLVGTRLHRAGVNLLPDVFLLPIPRLDVNWTWRVWEADATTGQFRLTLSNLLNPTLEWTQDDLLWRAYETGVDIGASFKITFL